MVIFAIIFICLLVMIATIFENTKWGKKLADWLINKLNL
jgi:hypothetical protein